MPKISNNTLRFYDGRDGRNRSFEDKHYYCHDDRVPRSSNNLYHSKRSKTSFKAQARPARTSRRNEGIGVAELKQLNEFRWYKITIPHGNKYEKGYIINNLLNYIAPKTFVPIMYKVSEYDATFYVDDKKIAVALLSCNRKITTNQRYKLNIRTEISTFPRYELDAEFKEKLKQAIAKRYVHTTKTLDLSDFHRDPDLISDYFCALFRSDIQEVVINVISEHIPDLEVLNLDRNKMDTIEMLCLLKLKLPKLRILHLGDNLIKNIDEIDSIEDLKLEELKLAGNPICKEYEMTNDYIKDVQKRFPDLLRLDGMDLPKPNLRDVMDGRNNLPVFERKFVASTDAQEFSESKSTEIQIQVTDTQVTDQISSVTEPLPVQLTEDIEQEMIMKLSQETNMNLHWSLKCLQELCWNYDNAFSAFEMFQKQGQIPAEAFSKEYCT